jgi:group I intron endonuclease
MEIVGIYKITNPMGAIYIGESKDIYRRWNKEYRNLSCKGQVKLYNSFVKYGFENHTFEIVKECKAEEIPYYERHYQEYYDVLDREFGLNLKYTKVGEKKQVTSEESRKKMSDAQKNLYENGYVHPMQGKKHSEESKKKNSESQKGKKQSEETIKKRIEKTKGRKHSEETLKKQSEAKKGKKRSEETKKKISEILKENYKNGYVNPVSKKVINTETNKVYNSVKECMNITGYKKISEKLNGSRKNNTPFLYLQSN